MTQSSTELPCSGWRRACLGHAPSTSKEAVATIRSPEQIGSRHPSNSAVRTILFKPIFGHLSVSLEQAESIHGKPLNAISSSVSFPPSVSGTPVRNNPPGRIRLFCGSVRGSHANSREVPAWLHSELQKSTWELLGYPMPMSAVVPDWIRHNIILAKV